MRGYNQAIIVGNLGADPEMRFTPGGRAVTSFSVACSRKYKDQDGAVKEDTQWFNIVCWDKLAESCNQNIGKGDACMVIGRISNRSWEDDKKVKHYKTEIIAGTVNFLSPKVKDNGDPGPDDPSDMPF